MMAIRCGHCKQHHDTVGQVRLCSKRHQRAKAIEANTAQVAERRWSEEMNAAWAQSKNEFAEREAAQERAVYEAELANGNV